jgi:hypothetical protein
MDGTKFLRRPFLFALSSCEVETCEVNKANADKKLILKSKVIIKYQLRRVP